MTSTILLQHASGVKRAVDIISISRWKNARNVLLPNVEIRWPIAGMYLLDLWKNQLVGAPSWGAENIEAAWALWVERCPGRWKELKHIVPEHLRKCDAVIQATLKRGEKAA